MNFSADLMESSKNGLTRILTAVEHVRELLAKASGEELLPGEAEQKEEAMTFVKKFEEAMEDDFNTADAISALFELVKFANTTAAETSSKAYLICLNDEMQKLCDVLGIITEKKEEILDADIEALIEERQAARKAKNFARADEIRDQLLAMGITLKDTREGVNWSRE